jgi:hypothetical protein
MEISGRFVELLEPKTGQSAKGSWKKQDFIIETEDQFPKKICISNWNDKVDLTKLKKGDQLNISVNIESREYNGNWYTDIKVWKMDLISGSDNTHSEGLPGLESSGSGEMPWDPGEDSSEPDLPF